MNSQSHCFHHSGYNFVSLPRFYFLGSQELPLEYFSYLQYIISSFVKVLKYWENFSRPRVFFHQFMIIKYSIVCNRYLNSSLCANLKQFIIQVLYSELSCIKFCTVFTFNLKCNFSFKRSINSFLVFNIVILAHLNPNIKIDQFLF